MVNPKAGLRAAKRTTDMGPSPKEAWYQCPPEAVEEQFQFDLTSEEEGSWLVVRQAVVGHRIVDFAINQLHNPTGRAAAGGNTYEVARIDCSHGSCHWHHMDKEGDWSRWGRIPILGLYDTTTHDVVDDLYWTCYELMLDRWEDNLARWRNT